jgi:hypothetical protein
MEAAPVTQLAAEGLFLHRIVERRGRDSLNARLPPSLDVTNRRVEGA